jgi:sugar phosphate isomerase/epimerase
MTAIGLLAKAHELGVGVVQVGPNLPLLALTDAELVAFCQQAADWNITLELGTRGIELEHLVRQIKLAAQIGAGVLRVIPELGGKPPTAEAMRDCVGQVLPLLAETGVCLGLENTRLPAAELRQVVKTISSPQVGIVLDTVNSMAVPEGYRQVAEILAPFTVCLHVKDFIVYRNWHTMGFIVEGRPAGQGQLDIPWLLNTVQATGARYNAILELWPPEQTSVEETARLEQAWVIDSIRYLRQYIRD